MSETKEKSSKSKKAKAKPTAKPKASEISAEVIDKLEIAVAKGKKSSSRGRSRRTGS